MDTDTNTGKFMKQDDAFEEYQIDGMIFLSDLDEVYEKYPKIDKSRISTVIESDDSNDRQLLYSGTRRRVNRVGYYVAAKPVPHGVIIYTTAQCIYCDQEKCNCKRCEKCWQWNDDCDCGHG